MVLRLYDTRARAVGPFEPLVAGKVGIYICGPTVQAAPHVGHLRSAIAFDILHRWLIATGYDVTFVRNVTDVDDKILHDAGHEGVPWWAHAARVERAFTAAYDAVHVLPPTAEPRATGHIPEMTALTALLVERGHAYVSGADVYLSVRSVPGYGELSGQTVDALMASEDAGTKRDPLDFALWKGGKPGEPTWDSPWGPGRPGWHLECSAMAVRYLGEAFDLHGGGLDLVFPHHENEIAQSTCAGYPFARRWLHHGLVTTGGEKMSKSLGNSALVADLLERVRPQVLRYYLGAPHYRSTLDYSPAGLAEAVAAYGRIETFVRHAIAAAGGLGEAEARALSAEESPGPAHAWAQFAQALDDDLAVPRALSVLHGAVRTGNAALEHGEAELAGWLGVVRRMLEVLALDPVAQWPQASPGTELEPVVDALVGVALEARSAARARADWAQADAVRDRLRDAGVLIEDTAQGTRWRLAEGR